MYSVQVLAQIRLNLASVDQFLTNACGLADDNPDIKESVYAAAKDARASALLIDHLRGLFSRQHSMEQLELEAASKFLRAKAAAFEPAGGQPQQQQQQLQLQRLKLDQNSQLFTYSNRLTLVRAAKSLVANVAKILYFTDSIALKSSSSQQQQQWRLQQHLEAASQNEKLGDRLDNVANYSQLLRSFGELSAELVNLGQCVMLSNQVRPLSERASSQQLAGHSAATSEWPCLEQTYSGPAVRGPNKPMADCPLSQLRNSVSSNLIFGQQQPQLANDYSARGHSASRQLGHQAEMGALHVEPSEAPTDWPGAAEEDKFLGETNPIELQIQDMQSLFQVNRLIIDRSILLLLSASKCCLRRGSEYLRGLEARQSIVGQIRASISIIMAIVKCSVFGAQVRSEEGTEAAQVEAENEGEVNFMLSAQQSALVWPSAGPKAPNSNPYSPPSQTFATDAPSTMSAPPSHANTTGAAPLTAVNFSRPQRDNKFDQQYLGRRSAPLAERQTVDGAQMFASRLERAKLAARQQDCWRQSQQFVGAHDEPSNDYNKTAPHRSSLASALQNGLPIAGKTRTSRNSPLQIMNYFLETWSGMQSAHDAINKLQLFVAPFAQVTNHKSLVGTLDSTLAAHFQGKEPKLAPRTWKPFVPIMLPMAGPISGCAEEKENCNQSVGVGGRGANSCAFMNKRQLIATLSSLFLGEIRSNLVERAHEFTDCAYTKHEHRESIVLLLNCIKLQLNKLVKLIYRLRRKVAAANELNLTQLRLLATQIGETCAELKLELQTVVIEQSDELDRCNSQLDLVRQMKHYCLVGDISKCDIICAQFLEQCEQLVEICRMLNQVAPTHKMKISTKTLAIWFELNVGQLIGVCKCLSKSPRSRVLKDCAWAYIQVWCSFYDDFCQLARQIAYLTHTQYDPGRSSRVGSLRDQMLLRHRLASNEQGTMCCLDEDGEATDLYEPNLSLNGANLAPDRRQLLANGLPVNKLTPVATRQSLAHASSVQSLNMGDALSDTTDSPRSLDHYHGFGANYHQRRAREVYQLEQQLRELEQEERLEERNEQLLQLSLPPTAQFSQPDAYSPEMRPLSKYLPSIDDERALRCEPADLAEQHKLRPPSSAPSSHQSYGQSSYSRPLTSPMLANNLPLGQLQHQPLRLNQPFVEAPRAAQVAVAPPPPPTRRAATIEEAGPIALGGQANSAGQFAHQTRSRNRELQIGHAEQLARTRPAPNLADSNLTENEDECEDVDRLAGNNTDQQSSTTDADKWSDSDADAIVRGAKETAQMALSMYQFTKGEGDLNTTQDLFTQAELFAEEANELYKEVRCFSYKVPAGELKKELLSQLATIPALVQQLQFIIKNPTVGKPATFAKVDSVIRETRSLMEAVNRVVTATLACRQHYNMAIASMRKRTRTLSPSYRGEKGFEFESHSFARQSSLAGRHGVAGSGSLGSEPDI